MPYEFLSEDLSTLDGRQTFAEFYSYFVEARSETRLLVDDSGFYTNWIADYPDEAKHFLEFCSKSEEPTIRKYAVRLTDEWIASQPEYVIDLWELLLSDEDESIRKLVSDRIATTILESDNAVDFIKSIGMKRTVGLIGLIKSQA